TACLYFEYKFAAVQHAAHTTVGKVEIKIIERSSAYRIPYWVGGVIIFRIENNRVVISICFNEIHILPGSGYAYVRVAKYRCTQPAVKRVAPALHRVAAQQLIDVYCTLAYQSFKIHTE